MKKILNQKKKENCKKMHKKQKKKENICINEVKTF